MGALSVTALFLWLSPVGCGASLIRKEEDWTPLTRREVPRPLPFELSISLPLGLGVRLVRRGVSYFTKLQVQPWRLLRRFVSRLRAQQFGKSPVENTREQAICSSRAVVCTQQKTCTQTVCRFLYWWILCTSRQRSEERREAY